MFFRTGKTCKMGKCEAVKALEMGSLRIVRMQFNLPYESFVNPVLRAGGRVK